MKYSTNSILVCILIVSCNTANYDSTTDNELEGRWKFIAVERNTEDTWSTDPWMENGTGYLIYNSKGHMALHITPEGYDETRIIWDMDSLEFSTYPFFELMVEETGRYTLSNHVFTGNFYVSGDTLTHEWLSHSNPQFFNYTIDRRFTITGDTLVIYPPVINPLVRVVYYRND